MSNKIIEQAFKNKTVDFLKLIDFGFTKIGDLYEYQTDILEGQFSLRVTVGKDGKLDAVLTDTEFDEPYTLFLFESAEGNFVGEVRGAYVAALERIAASCCFSQVYKSGQAQRVIAYAKEKYGDELEFLWKNDDDTSVLRRKDTTKWYAAFLKIPRRKLGIDSDERVEIIDLRRDQNVPASAPNGETIFPAYHMNKKSWITVCLDDSVSDEKLFALLDTSYSLAVK